MKSNSRIYEGINSTALSRRARNKCQPLLVVPITKNISRYHHAIRVVCRMHHIASAITIGIPYIDSDVANASEPGRSNRATREQHQIARLDICRFNSRVELLVAGTVPDANTIGLIGKPRQAAAIKAGI